MFRCVRGGSAKRGMLGSGSRSHTERERGGTMSGTKRCLNNDDEGSEDLSPWLFSGEEAPRGGFLYHLAGTVHARMVEMQMVFDGICIQQDTISSWEERLESALYVDSHHIASHCIASLCRTPATRV